MSEIKMVSNTVGSHHEELQDLFKLNATRLIIVSPYLASNTKELLDSFLFDSIESVELVTTFKPKDPEQLSKPYQLKDYFEYFVKKYPKVKVKLHIDNYLHQYLRQKSLNISMNFSDFCGLKNFIAY